MVNDIALVELMKPVSGITPVAISDTPFAANDNFGGDPHVEVYGWGDIDKSDGFAHPDKMQLGKMELKNQQDCKASYGYSKTDILESMVSLLPCTQLAPGLRCCRCQLPLPLPLFSNSLCSGAPSSCERLHQPSTRVTWSPACRYPPPPPPPGTPGCHCFFGALSRGLCGLTVHLGRCTVRRCAHGQRGSTRARATREDHCFI